jgi:5-methylcytosine-specific restriction endonuclease McrA
MGNHDNEKVPNRVRIRVWEAAKGICSSCKLKIRGEWELDHTTALINGGEHRENNFQILCAECHQEKTGDDVQIKSKTYRMKAKHLGISLKRKRRFGW